MPAPRRPWKPFIGRSCCTVDNRLVLGNLSLNLSRCRPTRPDFAKKVAEPPSFRRISISDLSSSSSARFNEEFAHAFGAGLYAFQLSELKAITHDFSNSYLLGEGGFGTVHKGYLDDRMRPGLKAQAVAVKLLDIEGLQGHREWLVREQLISPTYAFFLFDEMPAGVNILISHSYAYWCIGSDELYSINLLMNAVQAEVIFLGHLRHPHLVKLIGYCCEDEERLLVYEFMPRGSLENHLFKRSISVSVLSWGTRMKIATGAARGLAFLHGAEKPIIYRDFKTSNILLDSDFSAKLSDFGLAKMGPSGEETHVSTRVMGTQGYAAPEYVMTGHLTTKNDVYSFGVVLLELLTGRRSVDKSRPKKEEKLVEWSEPYLRNSRTLRCIMDPKLAGHYSFRCAREAAALALRCISPHPKDRPQMSEVVNVLQGLHSSLRGQTS